MSIIKYHGLYSLNFSCLNDFSSQLKFLDDNAKGPFQEAIRGSNIKKVSETTRKQIEMLTPMLTSFNASSQEDLFSGFVKNLEKVVQFADSVLAQYEGSDPYSIQQYVHEILGICKCSSFEINDLQRQTYLDLMKKSGFLITEYALVNREEAISIPHNTGALASSYLAIRPEVVRLSLGCGNVSLASAGCHFRRSVDHAQQSFTIDLSMGINPDLMADMHDMGFWLGIPDSRLEAILDHTYGYFLFDDSRSMQTLQQIFRCLKPGGYLEMDHALKESNVQMLRQVGFVVENGDTKVARKPQ